MFSISRYNSVMNSAMEASTFDKILVALHRLLPARLLGRLIYRLSRSERSWLKNMLIRGFTALYSVDTRDALHTNPEAYASFNAFFTRELRPGARPFTAARDALLCPADGTIAQTGHARNGSLLQAKGMYFSAEKLLGDAGLADELADAPFATIYLAPYNYHRVHMPLDGTLVRTRFIPGKLYSVNARTTATLANLYAVNERLVCEFATAHGPCAVVLVGAMNVASISTAWDGEIFPPADGAVEHRDFSAHDPVKLQQGDYLGHFNMGSTVVVLGPPGGCDWAEPTAPGRQVQVGETLARLK